MAVKTERVAAVAIAVAVAVAVANAYANLLTSITFGISIDLCRRK